MAQVVFPTPPLPRMSEMIPIAVPRRASVGLLQLQLDVHEVVGRPWSRVLEREQLLVLATRLLYPLVERRLLRPIDEERGIENHAITNRLVASTRHGDGLDLIMDVVHVALTDFLERGIDQTSKLHSRE